MKYFLDFEKLLSKKTKRYLQNDFDFFEKRIAQMKARTTIRTTSEYNAFLKGIISLFKSKRIFIPYNFPLYDCEKFAIRNSRPLTEKTAWGGISLKKLDTQKNYIEKFLIVDRYGALGFELHRKKCERLKILEGICMVLYSNHTDRNWKKGRISVKFGIPGEVFEFLPRDEHGILGFTKCVIQEKSTNHLDDLVYIFPAYQFR